MSHTGLTRSLKASHASGESTAFHFTFYREPLPADHLWTGLAAVRPLQGLGGERQAGRILSPVLPWAPEADSVPSHEDLLNKLSTHIRYI